MSNNSKPLIDSNVIIYAADRESLYYAESISILKKYLLRGCFLPDLGLIEFFQVITDAKKTPKPCSIEEAVQYIKHFLRTPEMAIVQVNTPKILSNPKLVDQLKQYKIASYGIYDYLIASCMRDHGIKEIITFNTRDFMKYEWLEVIDPQAQ